MYVNQHIIEKPEQDFWSKSESYKPNHTILEVCDVIKYKYKKHVQFLVKCIYGTLSPTFSCPAVFYFARDLKIVSIILRLWCLVISKVFTFFWACELSASLSWNSFPYSRLKIKGDRCFCRQGPCRLLRLRNSGCSCFKSPFTLCFIWILL